MDLDPSVLTLNWQEVQSKIVRFIKDYVEKARMRGIVLGLSGGIDSSTVAALSGLAIGGKNVLAIMLPEEETRNDVDIKHARTVARQYGLRTKACDITSTLNSLYKSIPIFDAKNVLCKGNLKARTRMTYLYYFSNKLHMLVCGSSDKSETMIGYFTKWGDGAADISPIMDLYKTQVRQLAEYIGIPEEIVAKASTPALWPNQTAEAELGMNYEQLDMILYGLEHFMKTEDIVQQLKVSRRLVMQVRQRWVAAEHKRRVSLAPKLGYRTIGWDFRLPHDPYQVG